MKYIVEYKLLDGTRMQCVLAGSSQAEVKDKSFRVLESLLQRRVIRGRKYEVSKADIVSVEKWNVQHKAANINGSKCYSVIITDRMGNQYSSTKCKAQGFKSAYNIMTNKGQDGDSYILYFYDNSQKPLYKSSTSEAKKLLQSKTKTVETLNKACEKSKQVEESSDISILDDVPLLCSMIYDYCKGNYKEVPLRTIIGATAAIIYFVSPIDCIPDCIPVVGHLDDIAVMSYALKCVHKDLMDYKAVKDGQPATA